MNSWYKQDKAIVFFDLESTGSDTRQDHIVEIALIRLESNGEEKEFRSLVNPEIPISPEIAAIHGITDEDVKDAPKFAELAQKVFEYFEDADVSGYNIRRFDLRLIKQEFKRAGLNFELRGRRIIDPMVIFQMRNPRTLGAAYETYCGATLKDAHSALADCRASMEVLKKQFEKHEDLPTDPDELHKLCNSPRSAGAIDPEGVFVKKFGKICVNIGKHKGRPLDDVYDADPGYLKWIMKSGGFSPEVEDFLANYFKEKSSVN